MIPENREPTGLFDAKGTEIFEGDIVMNFRCMCIRGDGVCKSSRGDVYVVSKSYAGFYPFHDIEVSENAASTNNKVVIGNKYEHEFLIPKYR